MMMMMRMTIVMTRMTKMVMIMIRHWVQRRAWVDQIMRSTGIAAIKMMMVMMMTMTMVMMRMRMVTTAIMIMVTMAMIMRMTMRRFNQTFG